LEYVSDKTNKVLGASAVRGQRQLMWNGVNTTCSQKLKRDDIFCEFYKTGDYNAQNAFLFGLIGGQECSGIYVKKWVNENSSRRHVSFAYYVKNSQG
jgi:hypothetical protein